MIYAYSINMFAEIHKKWQPNVYIEIGVETGKSLTLSRSVTRSDAFHLPDDWSDCCNMLNVFTDQSGFDLVDYMPTGGWK